MLPLFVAYYNLIRGHQAIGKRSAAAVGTKLKLGMDKSLELIKQVINGKRMADKIQPPSSFLYCFNLA